MKTVMKTVNGEKRNGFFLMLLLLWLVVALAVPTHSQFRRNDNEVFSHVSSSYEDQVKYMRRCVALAEEAMKNGQAPVRYVFFSFARLF